MNPGSVYHRAEPSQQTSITFLPKYYALRSFVYIRGPAVHLAVHDVIPNSQGDLNRIKHLRRHPRLQRPRRPGAMESWPACSSTFFCSCARGAVEFAWPSCAHVRGCSVRRLHAGKGGSGHQDAPVAANLATEGRPSYAARSVSLRRGRRCSVVSTWAAKSGSRSTPASSPDDVRRSASLRFRISSKSASQGTDCSYESSNGLMADKYSALFVRIRCYSVQPFLILDALSV